MNLFLSGCAAETYKTELMIASDLHYISQRLTDNGPLFMSLLEKGDGKVTEYCQTIVDTFVEEVIEQQPDVLILTGDLSFNGAYQSHVDLARSLKQVEEHGIPVLVLPGNHDLYYKQAASFEGYAYTLERQTTADDFRQIYEEFGFCEAGSVDDASLSYIYPLNEELSILMIDTNTPEEPCTVREETLHWIEQQLQEAQQKGIRVIAAGHQNLFQHSFFTTGYVIGRSEQLSELLKKYGVELFISGHMHLQHIRSQNDITEIASSSLAVSPCQYGILQVSQRVMDYHTRILDVEGYAKRHGLSDEHLLDFRSYAEERMSAKMKSQAAGQIPDNTDMERMTDTLIDAHLAYFSGDLSKLRFSKYYRQWIESGSWTGSYLSMIRGEIGRNYTKWHHSD